jgi:hypothetical protein
MAKGEKYTSMHRMKNRDSMQSKAKTEASTENLVIRNFFSKSPFFLVIRRIT